MSSILSAMDFSNAGTTEPAGAGFRAHVQWYDKGARPHIYGPNREDQQAAQEDLESMRAAATGMSVTGGGALRTGMFWRKGTWTRPLYPYPFQTLP